MSRPKPASHFLPSILKAAGTTALRAEFATALDAALDEKTRRHCHVAGYRDGKLVVEVDSAPLFAELSGFRREQIRVALNENLKRRQVARLVFRLGGTGHV